MCCEYTETTEQVRADIMTLDGIHARHNALMREQDAQIKILLGIIKAMRAPIEELREDET